MNILIAGLGFVGGALAQSLVHEGAHVWGLRREPSAIPGLEKSDRFHLIQADLTRPRELGGLPLADVVVLCQAPSRPGDTYEKTYEEGTRCLLSALVSRRPGRLILVSSTSVYGTRDGSWVDETTDPGIGFPGGLFPAKAGVLMAMERSVLQSGFPAVVFRVAGIYGPSRNRIRALHEGRAEGAFTGAFTNRMHRDDVVAGIRFLMDHGRPGEIYLGADDEPTTQAAFYRWLYDELGLKVPAGEATDAGGRGKRCSNRKIKTLGFRLKHPTFREGYTALLKSEAPLRGA